MSWFGTDIIALGCIVGSAAASGGMTLALLGGENHERTECSVATIQTHDVGSHVVVSRGDHGHSIVMRAPRVRVHSSHDCGAEVVKDVQIHVEQLRHEVDEARMIIGIRRAEAAEAREMARSIRIQGREVRELREQAREQAREAEIQIREALIQVKEAQAAGEEGAERVRVILRKGQGGSGGQMD